jgi:hypothetical protein
MGWSPHRCDERDALADQRLVDTELQLGPKFAHARAGTSAIWADRTGLVQSARRYLHAWRGLSGPGLPLPGLQWPRVALGVRMGHRVLTAWWGSVPSAPHLDAFRGWGPHGVPFLVPRSPLRPQLLSALRLRPRRDGFGCVPGVRGLEGGDVGLGPPALRPASNCTFGRDARGRGRTAAHLRVGSRWPVPPSGVRARCVGGGRSCRGGKPLHPRRTPARSSEQCAQEQGREVEHAREPQASRR